MMNHLFFDYETPPGPCPRCGTWLSAAATVTTGGPPEPGDITICSSCAEFLIFGDNLQLRAATPTEDIIYGMDPQYGTPRAILRHLLRQGADA